MTVCFSDSRFPRRARRNRPLRPGERVEAQDRYAAEHLIGAASGVVRDVARMQSAARRAGARLLTFTIEAELRFAAPADVERFADRLPELVAEAASGHTTGRPYRLVLGAHPAPAPPTTEDPHA